MDQIRQPDVCSEQCFAFLRLLLITVRSDLRHGSPVTRLIIHVHGGDERRISVFHGRAAILAALRGASMLRTAAYTVPRRLLCEMLCSTEEVPKGISKLS